MKTTLSPTLNLINDLGYVIECAAMSHMGEGKSELRRLINSLESDPAFAVQDRLQIAERLRDALDSYLNGDAYRFSNVLSQVIRNLWNSLTLEKPSLATSIPSPLRQNSPARPLHPAIKAVVRPIDYATLLVCFATLCPLGIYLLISAVRHLATQFMGLLSEMWSDPSDKFVVLVIGISIGWCAIRWKTLTTKPTG